jgi:hypothetical protein
MSAELGPCAIAEIGSSATNAKTIFRLRFIPDLETRSTRQLLSENVPPCAIVNKNRYGQIPFREIATGVFR